MSPRKIDKAWKKYFNRTNKLDELDSQGYCYVNADKLKEFGEREPRLMAKMDTKYSRPKIFKSKKLSIFPVENGRYIIFQDGEEKSYYDLKDLKNLEVEKYNSDVNLNKFATYPSQKELSESQAIDFGFISSLFKNFTSDDHLNLTIRGRLYSNCFTFNLPNNNHKVEVSGVQIEIDSGYESEDAIYLIEAKTGKRDNFHIRQLYYPYLEWSNSTNKQVVPIFLTFTSGKYYLVRFSFSGNFGNLKVEKKKCFTINEEPKPRIDLESFLFKNTREPKTPFPQANDLDKIINLIEIVNNEKNRSEDIAEYFGLEKRQANYYASAAEYLGFLSKDHKNELKLNSSGNQFLSAKNRAERLNLLIKKMTTKSSLNEIFKIFYKRDFEIESISQEEITNIITKYRSDLNKTTRRRRASTIQSWLKWLINNCDFK